MGPKWDDLAHRNEATFHNLKKISCKLIKRRFPEHFVLDSDSLLNRYVCKYIFMQMLQTVAGFKTQVVHNIKVCK